MTCQCCIQNYFEVVILVWDPKLRPQILKSIDFCCKLSSLFVVAELRSNVLSYSECKIAKIFWTSPVDPTGEGLLQNHPDSPAAQRFFFLLCLPKNCHSLKIPGYSAGRIYDAIFLQLSTTVSKCVFFPNLEMLFRE